MSWILLKQTFEKSWIWLKHNWKVPLFILYTISVALLSRRNSTALQEALEANKRAHKEEVEVLRRSHNEELLKIKSLHREYEKTILEMEKRFKKDNKKLSQKHIEDIKEIVIKSKGNPEKIKKKIEEDFGIKFK